MREFTAINAKQLDLCLRMLYAENMIFFVKVVENNKQKIMYEISVNIDECMYKKLNERYRILIS